MAEASFSHLVMGLKVYERLSDEGKKEVTYMLRSKLDEELENSPFYKKKSLKNLSLGLAKVLAPIDEATVFLSYSHADKKFVHKLSENLTNNNINVWLDEAEIRAGESLIDKLRAGIDKADFLIVVLSKSSINSEWVKKEIDIAMNQEIEGKKIKVLPIMKDKVSLPGFLFGKFFLDFTTPYKRLTSTKVLIENIHSLKKEEI